jgi:hypothetical protein
MVLPRGIFTYDNHGGAEYSAIRQSKETLGQQHDHLVREIAAVLDLSWVHSELAPYYPRLGRPSIDPVLMIRMLIVGYVFAIRSERALCRDMRVNLAYRWFCGLSIEDKIRNHSAFSRARNERFRDSGVFRSWPTPISSDQRPVHSGTENLMHRR